MNTTPQDTFDFDSVEVLESADLRIKDPSRNNAPTGIVITLASPIHPDRKRSEQAVSRRMQAVLQKTGKLQLSDPEERELEELDKLVACTLGWVGSKTPFSRDAARKVYADPRRLHIRMQVREALDDMELFTQACAQS
jgi:hypothetical protein